MSHAVTDAQQVGLGALSQQRSDRVARKPDELAVSGERVELVEGEVARVGMLAVVGQPFGVATEVRGAVEGVAGESDRFVHRANLTAPGNKRSGCRSWPERPS